MELPLWIIVVLAVVQGITEFLPISSSGHVVILAGLFSEDLDVLQLNIVLHAGTLGSILVVYWQRLWRLLGEDRRIIGLLLVGTFPAVLLGLPLKEKAGWLLEDPLLAGCMLPVTGAILLLSRRWTSGQLEYPRLGYGSALKIGIAQAVAILPGISRSGSSITAGMQQKLAPRDAATFSFLLAVPALCGAALLGLIDLVGEEPAEGAVIIPIWHLALGAAISFVVGVFALLWLLRWIDRGRLHYFAWWCIPVGLGVIVWQLIVRST